MNTIKCPRCSVNFYTAAHEKPMNCPTCSYEVKIQEMLKRIVERREVNHVCEVLLNEGIVARATAVDLSERGIGIKMTGQLPFEKDDTVKLLLEGQGAGKTARVVWKKNFYGVSRAGFRFC